MTLLLNNVNNAVSGLVLTCVKAGALGGVSISQGLVFLLKRHLSRNMQFVFWCIVFNVFLFSLSLIRLYKVLEAPFSFNGKAVQ